MTDGQRPVYGTFRRLPFLPYAATPACAQGGTREVFQRAGDKGSDLDVAAAKRVCEGCEFKADCGAYALATRQTWGIWGGTRMYGVGAGRHQRRRAPVPYGGRAS